MADITRYRGDTQPLTLSVTASGGISGWTFTLTIDENKNPTGASTNELQLSGTVTSSTASGGEVEFRPTEAEADLLGTFYYDVEADDGTYKRTLEKGTIEFLQDITK